MLKLANVTTVYRATLIANVYHNWLKSGGKVLDIGCGTGVVAFKLQKLLGIKITGCDVDKYLLRNIPFKKMLSFKKLPFRKNQFDSAMFNDVLHHTDYENQISLIKEALRISNKVLVFELIPTLQGKWADLIINKIHNPKMNIPYTYRSPAEWKRLFHDLGLKVKSKKLHKPFFYPFTHIGFYLQK